MQNQPALAQEFRDVREARLAQRRLLFVDAQVELVVGHAAGAAEVVGHEVDPSRREDPTHLGERALHIGVVGSFAGNRLGRRLPQATLRRLFGLFLVVMGVFVAADAVPRLLH